MPKKITWYFIGKECRGLATARRVTHQGRACFVIRLDRLIFRNSSCDRQRLMWIAIERIISIWVCGYLFSRNCPINTAFGSAFYVQTNNTSLAWRTDIWQSLMVPTHKPSPMVLFWPWRVPWASAWGLEVPGSAHASLNNPRPHFSDQILSWASRCPENLLNFFGSFPPP